MSEVWADGARYESYIGRWSRAVARSFVGWLAVPAAATWLDVGSGTGALAATIVELASPSAVVALDPSRAYVEHARTRLSAATARVAVGDARSLPFADGSFDACVSGLVLNFVPHPSSAVEEMTRVTRPGGTIAAYLWDYAGQMQLIRRFWDAATALDPDAAQLDEGRRFPIADRDALARLFTDARLEAVETRAIDVDTVFANFDELWTPFLGGQGPAPAYVASLSDDRRARLRERLRERLRASVPAAADGSIALVARAWAVRGRTGSHARIRDGR